MFIFENDSTQNAHLSKSKNDRVNSWYENHRIRKRMRDLNICQTTVLGQKIYIYLKWFKKSALIYYN